jgi:hypothetical protein
MVKHNAVITVIKNRINRRNDFSPFAAETIRPVMPC